MEAVVSSLNVDKEVCAGGVVHPHTLPQVTKFARNAAQTFAPRASGAVKNPAYKGADCLIP